MPTPIREALGQHLPAPMRTRRHRAIDHPFRPQAGLARALRLGDEAPLRGRWRPRVLGHAGNRPGPPSGRAATPGRRSCVAPCVRLGQSRQRHRRRGRDCFRGAQTLATRKAGASPASARRHQSRTASATPPLLMWVVSMVCMRQSRDSCSRRSQRISSQPSSETTCVI